MSKLMNIPTDSNKFRPVHIFANEDVFKLAYIFTRDDIYDIIETLRMQCLFFGGGSIHSPVVNKILTTECSLTVDYLTKIMDCQMEKSDDVTDRCIIQISGDCDHTFLYMDGYVIQSFNNEYPLKYTKMDKSELIQILNNLDAVAFEKLTEIKNNIENDDELEIEYYNITSCKTDGQSIKKNIKSILDYATAYVNESPETHFLQIFERETTPNDLHITIYDCDPNLEKSIERAKSELKIMYSLLETME